ncbi:TPA: helix-turn-helix transcriptional regulator [Candidatus Avigastranaerophilus faecigallinarum]|nr:helix-turn-helix transcriptional regulator [Candidatus Avigastranaerophilus faecigallinarum]
MTIGKRIKELKTILHLTSLEMANELSIPVRTIGSYERDEAQPGPKFLNALIDKFCVNINWLLSGRGNMFITKKAEKDIAYIAQLQERLKLTNEELNGLIDILDADASREMVLKFIEIKKGNKEALDSLIYNLQGIKAIYG